MSRLASVMIGFAAGAALGAGAMWLAQRPAERPPMAHASAPVSGPPAYLVVLGEVIDREKFMTEYTAKLPPVYEKFGGTYLAAGRNFEVFEGEATFRSFVISQFPSMEAARAFWTSPEYDALRRARIEGNWGRFDVFALEGLPKPAASTPLAAEAEARKR
jgi:uncharacterized protein (DUF1330 family)